MKVIIIRHGKVDFQWHKRCTSMEFDNACAEYDLAPLEEKMEASFIRCRNIYISTLPRTRETAKMLFPDKQYRECALLNEVPLRAWIDTKMRMPLWIWNVMGRVQWAINSKRQQEGRNSTKVRATEFVRLLDEEKRDAVVITHGFYMHTMLKAFESAGFRVRKTRVHYKNGEYVLAEKEF
ncbi:MAG: histidine phosphatase family protein [Lachnospiraceae bacterium]|nr:histidine phosphatase family protein [Lachnospiraceae bacterium]